MSRPRRWALLVERADFPEGGLQQCRSEKSSQGEPARGQHVPFSGLVQAHPPGKSRVFAAVGMEGTGETDWPAEGTGFEPSVPLGRIGASKSAWIEFGRRLGLRIEHAISIDGWEVCDGRTSWRFFMKQVAFLTVIRARCSISVTAREFADKSAAR